jgi:hypothetical protein
VTKVAALYIDPKGPYPGLLGPEMCWDEKRDARTYEGPWPVIAHPPCGPWGRLKFLNKHQDPTCGPSAVHAVRAFGGILEHPQDSTLWKHCQIPAPYTIPDQWGGMTIEVCQVNWGHRCKKATWLYLVGIDRGIISRGIRRGAQPTHRITNGSRGPTWLPRVSAAEARRTPPEFAAWLIALACTVEPRQAQV